MSVFVLQHEAAVGAFSWRRLVCRWNQWQLLRVEMKEAAPQVSAQLLDQKESLSHSFRRSKPTKRALISWHTDSSSILLRAFPNWRILRPPASQSVPGQAGATRARSDIREAAEGLQPLPGVKQGKAGQTSGLLPPELCSAFALTDLTNRKRGERRGLRGGERG